MAMAIFDDHIMTDLPTDSVPIVFSSGHAANLNLIHILKEDATAVISIQQFVVGPVSIKGQIFDHKVLNFIAGHERKQRGTSGVADRPIVLAKGLVEFESIARPSDKGSLQDFGTAIVRVFRLQTNTVADFKSTRVRKCDLLIIPVRILRQLRRDGGRLG